MNGPGGRLRTEILIVFATIMGAALAAYMQHLSWNNQWLTQKSQREVEVATKAFRDISSLVDKRNYRMRRMLWGIESDISDDEYRDRLDQYREVLFEWNDSLNSNLAIAKLYFGDDIRRILEIDIAGNFRRAGQGLQCEIERRKEERFQRDCQKEGIANAEDALDSVSVKIYELNVVMLKAVEELAAKSKPKDFFDFFAMSDKEEA